MGITKRALKKYVKKTRKTARKASSLGNKVNRNMEDYIKRNARDAKKFAPKL